MNNKLLTTALISSTVISLGLLGASPSSAALIFDDGSGSLSTNRAVGTSPLNNISVAAPVTISQIGVDVDLSADGNIKFLIFSAPDNNPTAATLIFESSPTSFVDDGRSFKVSDVFSPVTLQPTAGLRYYIGGIADVEGAWYFSFGSSETQDDITSFNENPNVSNFNTPTLAGSLSSVRVNLQLFDVDVQTTPEPSSLLGLIGVGLLGVVTRKRK